MLPVYFEAEIVSEFVNMMSETVSSNPRWYAVQCLSNHEDKVRRFLTRFREDDENFSNHLKEILVPIETVSLIKSSVLSLLIIINLLFDLLVLKLLIKLENELNNWTILLIVFFGKNIKNNKKFIKNNLIIPNA